MSVLKPNKINEIKQAWLPPNWLPNYDIKRHQRAKHVKFRFHPSEGLVITLPVRFSLHALPAILETHRTWILMQASVFAERRVLPTTLTLPFLNKTWSIKIEPKLDRPRLRELKSQCLVLSIDDHAHEQAFHLLKMWLRRQALRAIPPYFKALSDECGLPYRSLSIRSQSSIWGSCSADHSIRLNDRLLFFPENLARHIMIHELCHTKELNHSVAFWQRVSQFDNHYREHKKLCRHYQSMLPSWAV